MVLFEVLSRSNTKADQAWRRRVYASVPNCQHYVTVSLKTVEVVAYDRVPADWQQRSLVNLAEPLDAAGTRPRYSGRGHLSLDAARPD